MVRLFGVIVRILVERAFLSETLIRNAMVSFCDPIALLEEGMNEALCLLTAVGRARRSCRD